MKPDKVNLATVVDRATSPTPAFFKKLRRVFVVAGVVGGSILTMGPAAPAALLAVAPWLLTAGAVGSAVATLTKENPDPEASKEGGK